MYEFIVNILVPACSPPGSWNPPARDNFCPCLLAAVSASVAMFMNMLSAELVSISVSV